MSIFGLAILVLIGVIAFCHYTQGFFSAAISAIISVLAAAIALGYQETLVNSLLQGKFADDANAIALVVLFAFSYFILRIIFDSFVPGNIRLPVLVDKIGAGAMGVIAGIFGAGVLAIAAQTMPFGPSVAGYSRYTIGDERQVVVTASGIRSAQDATVSGELKGDQFTSADSKGIILPADDIVVGAVSSLSNDGALGVESDKSFSVVHPNYLDELFADRLGIQTGAKHTAMNITGHSDVQVDGVYSLSSVAQTEAELKDLRPPGYTPKHGRLTPGKSQILLVVRAIFSHNATDDTDSIFRFSPASCRLVVPHKNEHGDTVWEDRYPIGTLNDKGTTMLANRLDDFLFVEGGDKGADLVYLLERKDVLSSEVDKKGEEKIAPGVFLEVKRLARVDLGGRTVKSPIVPGGEKVAVMRKPDVISASGSAQATNAPLNYDSIEASSKLFSPINVGKPDADGSDMVLRSGIASFKDKKFTRLTVNGTDSLQQLGPKGAYNLDALTPPTGKVLMEVKAHTPPKSTEPWTWADQLGELELADEAGNRYKPCGAFAMTVKSSGAKAMVGAYDFNGVTPTLTHNAEDGRPQDVYLYYPVPSGTHLTQFLFHSQLVAELQQVVP